MIQLKKGNAPACVESGAEATAISRNAGLARLSNGSSPREASGLRRVHRRIEGREGNLVFSTTSGSLDWRPISGDYFVTD
jgi:hypothetical protein